MTDPGQIFFGLNRTEDEASLRIFLKLFANNNALLDILLPQLDDTEISATVDFLTGLMHRHLNDAEYHKLFLDQQG